MTRCNCEIWDTRFCWCSRWFFHFHFVENSGKRERQRVIAERGWDGEKKRERDEYPPHTEIRFVFQLCVSHLAIFVWNNMQLYKLYASLLWQHFFSCFFLHFSGEKAHTHTQARKPTLNTHSNDAAYQRQPHNNNNVSLCSRLNLQTPVAGHYFICSVQLANILLFALV